MKIGIIGAGFVGLSLAVVLSNKGFNVIVVDSDKEKLKKIQLGMSPFFEPKINSFLKKEIGKKLTVSDKIYKVIDECKFVFLAVGTPINKNGQSDLKYIKLVANEISNSLVNSKNRPIIIIKSTVPPGTNELIQNLIEKKSLKKKIKDFGMLSNPEFLREGKAIEDTLNPHMIAIGGNHNDDILELKGMYQKIYKKNIPYILTNPKTAEMIKFANNSFLATKISFINQISCICQNMPGVNIDDVANAIGMDPRIGNLFLKAGPGYGGSCLPKDLQALISFTFALTGQKPKLLEAVKKTNENQRNSILEFLKNKLKTYKNKKILILGLSFKEDTDDIRESVSIKIIKQLLTYGSKIIVHDPVAMENTKDIFGSKIEYAYILSDAIRESDCIILMTPWNEYRNLIKDHNSILKNKIIFDTRRLWVDQKLGSKYYSLGVGKSIVN